MLPSITRRQVLGSAVLGVTGTALAADDTPPKPESFTGKVQQLADVAKKAGAKLDADAAPFWFVLIAEDRKVYPLLKDAGSRMFFADKKLLDRPMRLIGRRLPESQILQVMEVHSLIKGEPHEVYYWCDICSIRRFEKMACECCGAPMELKETPLKKR